MNNEMAEPSISVVAVMTCHNRRDVTLRCLDSLRSQIAPGIKIAAWLTDDGSTDGTAEAVQDKHPWVNVITADGSLFWGGGTRLADEAAFGSSADFHLWLNDDVILNPDAVSTLVSASGPPGEPVVIAGAVVSPETGAVTYSGLRRSPGWRLRYSQATPDGSVQPIDTMNGNVVLVSSAARKTLGPIDPAFTHNMGDVDYGFRAARAGIRVALAPTSVGTCSYNESKQAGWTKGLNPVQRLRAMTNVRQLPPAEWATFARRYCGRMWPIVWASPYVKSLLPTAMARTGSRYDAA